MTQETGGFEPAANRETGEKRLVWDLPLRLFHWLLALTVLGLWIAAENDYMQYHFYLGYFMIGLIIFRVIWGFVGPRHARFSSFFPTPAGILDYTKKLFGGGAVQTVGHNPLGSLMVFVMLILFAVQTGSGLFATDDIIWSGPYNPAVSGDTADFLTTVHHTNFNIILAAIALHILAVALYAILKKQNLVRPMVTGKKSAAVVPEGEAIQGAGIVKTIIVIAISAALVYWLLSAAPPPPSYSF